VPEVSLIIPVYNARPFARKAVESALNQGVDLEIVVVDDGSTDGSLASLEGLPVTKILQPKNQGIACALNRALGEAKGQYITFLDADDLLSPGGLKWRVDWLKAHPQARAVGGRPEAIIDENGELLPQYRHLLTPGYEPPETLTLTHYQSGNIYPCLIWLFLFRREFIDAIGRFDETYESVYDCDYLFRALQLSPIPIVFEPAVIRRWHDSNHSVVGPKHRRELHPRTIREVKAVCQKYGIKTGEDFHLWESGYQPIFEPFLQG
jgi:glycosyltransferase involved in cell wall biosynthesis